MSNEVKKKIDLSKYVNKKYTEMLMMQCGFTDIDDFLDALFDQGLYICVACSTIVKIDDMPDFEASICKNCLRPR